MKKINVISLILMILLSGCVHRQPPQDIHARWGVEKRLTEDTTPRYKIRATYPEISSSPANASANEINQHTQKFIGMNIEEFKDGLPIVTEKDVYDYPAEMKSNYLLISSSSYLGDLPQGTIVSLRFNVEKIYYSRMIPSQKFAVFNYNLTHAESLELEALFKPGYPYLKVIADYCKKKLATRLAPDMPWLPWDAGSLAPEKRNYRLWALQGDGILFVFTKEQLDPYSPTGEMLLVPFSVVRDGLVLVKREYKVMTGVSYKELSRSH